MSYKYLIVFFNKKKNPNEYSLIFSTTNQYVELHTEKNQSKPNHRIGSNWFDFWDFQFPTTNIN